MIIDKSPQGTPEWLQARAGVLTASDFWKLITAKGNPTTGKIRTDYLLEKANERLTMRPCNEFFSNYWMKRGTELEPQARAFYEFVSGHEVEEAGLAFKDEDRLVGASVDGLVVGADINLEIKCPKLSTHLSYIIDGKVPTDYYSQVQGQLYVTGRSWCDFVSFHPDAFKIGMILRVERDQEFIDVLERELERANEAIDKLCVKLKKSGEKL